MPEQCNFLNKEMTMSTESFLTIHVLFLDLVQASSNQDEKRQTFVQEDF